MGNTESSVSSSVKAQANASLPVYDLVDVNGGGELIELMKKATKTKDYSEIDETIRTKVALQAYNKGQGKCLNVHTLVQRRNKEKPLSKQITFPKSLPDEDAVAGKFLPGVDDPAKLTDHATYRYQFWDLAHVGAVGETIVHLCVLNASSVHNELVKRLLRIYPNMINDVYLADEYYGENALHISIVNEDPAMVKFLLDNGANYHERCIGNFFCTEDQKPSKQDNSEHEWYDLTTKTNYYGYVYWGEYPLSFAACLDQEECYRLILAKGANPDNQDTNGNTVTHMMVIYDKMEMFDMCFEAGAAINIPNRQNLIPMTLACVLARRDLFFHILNITREIYWQIGYVTCAAYPLEYFDTINVKTGDTETKSALNLIAYGNKEEHLDLMEGPVVDLLKTKWATFVKFKFYNLFFVFLTYFFISMGSYVLRPVPCVPVGSMPPVASKPAVMVLPALGVTCVNVTVDLAEHYVVVDHQVTTIPNFETTFVGSAMLDSDSPLNVAHTLFNDPNVTAFPLGDATFEVDMPVDSSSDSFDVFEPSVTATPDDAVTVQYFVEGEEITATVTSRIHEMMTVKSTNGTSTNDDGDKGGYKASTFSCYNTSHHLTLVGINTSFFITKIVKRDLDEGDPPSMAADSPYDNNDSLANAKEDPCHCYLWKVPKPLAIGEEYYFGVSWSVGSFYVRVFCEFLTAIGSFAYLVGAAREARFQGLQMFFENLSTVPSRVLFLFACVLVMCMLMLRVTCQGVLEDCLAVMAMLCTGPYFLFFCRGFKTVGPFVTMIYTMLVGDLLRFVTIYFVFVMGFSQAYYVIYTSYTALPRKSHCKTNPLSTPVESVMNMFIMSLGNFGAVYEGTECTAHETSGKVLFLVFMAIVSLLLINLLIAMMGNTYTIIAEMKNEWMRQWARIVLVVERGVNPEERLRQQKKYSQPMTDGRPALLLRLHQNEDEREEMRDVLDMKRVHRKYIQRRLAKQKAAAAKAAGAAAGASGARAEIILDPATAGATGSDMAGVLQ